MRTYELRIGYCLKSAPENPKFVYREYFEAETLHGAKMYATKILKSLNSMEQYVVDSKGKEIRWSVWSQKAEDKRCCWYTNKRSVSQSGSSQAYGFCQLNWESRQLSLFDMPVSA